MILAATLILRDAFALATSLERLAGAGSQLIFGIGVLGMALSTIIMQMLINGFVVCEMASKPSAGRLYQFGCVLPAISGALGALFLRSDKAQFYLAVPISRFAMVLLPIAYIGFLFLMNNKQLLGDAIPKGAARIWWNGLMLIAVFLSLAGAAISILNDTSKLPGTDIELQDVGLTVFAVLFVWALILHVRKPNEAGI